MHGLVEVVRVSRSLVLIGGRDTEVSYLPCRAKRWHQIVGPAAADCSARLSQALISICRTDKNNGSLVRNRHLGLGDITVKRPDDTCNQCIANQGRHILRANRWIVGSTGTNIIFSNEYKLIHWYGI